MNEMNQPTEGRQDSSSRISFWGNIVLTALFILVSIYFLTRLFQEPRTPVIYLGTSIFIGGIAASLVSLILTLRNQQLLGARLMFFAANTLGITIIGLFQGRAPTASLTILMISAITIQWLLPRELKRSHSFIAVGVFALIWVIEWLNPAWRVRLDAAPVGPVAAVLFAVILGGMVFMRSRRFLAASIATSLRLQITVWTGAIVAILSIIILTYSIVTSRQAAIQSAEAETLAVAEAQAGIVKSQFDPALNTSRTMAYTLRTVKDPNAATSLTREQVNAMLKKVAEENPTFLGTWTIWEPNAFDGQDSHYANTPLHDATGRFIPYWVRVNDTVEGVAVIDYETPISGLNDWYFIPRETKKETLITPYLYPINGVDVLMTTISIPIVENDTFYGTTGVDYRMDFVQGLVDQIDLFDGTASAVLFTEAGTLVAVHNQPELALQPGTSVFEDFEQIQAQLTAGEPFIHLSPDGKALRVFSPIKIGEADQWWFSLIVPFSEITAPATASAVRESAISIAAIIVSLLVLWYLTGQLVRPILNLTTVANAVSGGNLNASAIVETSNEIGILASTFNSMTSQLRETLSTLEQRVADRTRNLELAAEVGRAVSQVRDLDVMLKDACELILKEFSLYYVQVYLTDAAQMNLQLEAGTGTVGAQLVERGHSLPINTGSINGRAATEQRSIVISDTTQSATFRQNPLLPETRGELAIPLIVGNTVVGVLDMQSREPGVLTEEALPAFEALAGQLAVAVQNANLLAETEQARAQVESQARRLVRSGWIEHLDAIHKPEQLGFVFDRHNVMPLTEVNTTQAEGNTALTAPISVTGESLGSLVVEMNDESRREQTHELIQIVARQVAQQIENLRLLESAERYRSEAEKTARLQTLEGWQKYVESRSEAGLGYLFDTKEVHAQSAGSDSANSTMYAHPLKAREEMIGQVSVEGLTHEDQESVNLVNTVAERLSAHIENLRLFEETRQGQLELDKRAKQLAAVAEISTVSSQELEVDKLLSTVVHLTQRQFDLYHAHVFVFNESTESLEIVACGWNEGNENEGTHEHVSIPLDKEQSLVARAARTKHAVIVNDVKGEAGWLPNPLLPDTASEMAVPLIVGDRVLGVLDVQSDRVNAFNEEDANIQTTLASQVATAMQNARSFTQAQKQAERESMLNVINQKIQSATSVEAVLQIAARELGRALGAPMTIAQLSMKDRAS